MTLQISTQPALGMQGPDVTRVHQALQALGRDIPVSERKQRVFGPSTVAVIKALQAELNLPATGVVDAATVRAINVRLEKRGTEQRIVRGLIRDANGAAVASGAVQIFSQNASGEQVIGKAAIAADGSYQVSYAPPTGGNGRVDLRIAVFNKAGAVLETTPGGDSILTNAGSLEVVNFALSGKTNQPLSEFEQIMKDLGPLLGARKLAELKEEKDRHEVSFLAIQSGYLSEVVASCLSKHKVMITSHEESQ